MALRLRNTLTRKIEPFVPLDPAGKQVLMYSCGPTVYSFAHIGNFRSFLLADLLRRVLERRGYRVRHVMNITDVGHMTEDHLADAGGEDKLAKAARELGSDPFRVARHFEGAFVEDAKALGLKNYAGKEGTDPSLHPRATAFIPEMLAMIQQLLDRDVAYVDENGQVYFEIAKFPQYGELSGKQIDELEAGARVEVREGKRDPRDFALWKADKKHLMQWDPHSGEGFSPEEFARLKTLVPNGIDSRVARGFPGWHIECSAMARACLADRIDIHTGGEDNIFPHHECETAQTCAALGVDMPTLDGSPPRVTFARHWVHGRHLLVDNRKMSKRDGTFYTLRNLLDPVGSGRPELAAPLKAIDFGTGSVPPAVLRLALLSVSFTLPMNFSFDTLAQARANVQRLQGRYERLREIAAAPPAANTTPSVDDTVSSAIERCQRAFDDALDDNLDLPTAMTAVWALVGELNQVELSPGAAARALTFMESLDEVLGVLDRRVNSGVLTFSDLDRLAQEGALPSADDLARADSVDAELVVRCLAARHAAKKQKQYPQADALRKGLQQRNVSVEDMPTGVRWRLP